MLTPLVSTGYERELVRLQSRFATFQTSLPLDLAHTQVQRSFEHLILPDGWTLRRTDSAWSITRGQQSITVQMQAHMSQPHTVSAVVGPSPATTIVFMTEVHPGDLDAHQLIHSLEALLTDLSLEFAPQEIAAIVDSMPLLNEFKHYDPEFSLAPFALIWRDHFLEEKIPLLHAFEHAGIEPQWIYALSKGDNTQKWQRISHHFHRRGYIADTFAHQGWEDHSAEQQAMTDMIERLKQFIAGARAAGKRIMLIDDGGLLLQQLADQPDLVDLALELTIAGIRRVERLAHVPLPIYDIARSDFKAIITYPEIAESCVRRIRELLAAEKFSGRSLLIIGYGAAGRGIARLFRNMGCNVAVVDTNMLALIDAAEQGLRTFTNVLTALQAVQPFLVIGCTGEASLNAEDFGALPHNAYVTAVASRDLSTLKTLAACYHIESLPDIGLTYTDQHGKRFIQLGDGRSINLFRSEAIPNRANDVFKTGIFVAAKALCRAYTQLDPGLHVTDVNRVILESGLLDRYYDLYLRERSIDDRSQGMNRTGVVRAVSA